MALINCPECGKEISDKSNVCIHCGYPISKYLEDKRRREEEIAENEKKLKQEKQERENKEKEKYWCRKCYRQNSIGEDYCVFCGARLTPMYEMEHLEINKEKPEKLEIQAIQNKEFHGIYKYTLFGGKQEVRCPRCKSENCSHYKEQHEYQTIIPAKTKTRYTANLNPLHPFTLVNKKEKVKRKEKVKTTYATEDKIMCNDCGYIFT